jgi:hypothetical protein
MQQAYRLLSVIFAILGLILAGVLLAQALGWVIPNAYLQSYLFTDNRWIAVIADCVVILLALLLIVMAVQGRPRFRELLIQDNALGRVDISVSALQDMIRRASRHVREIREIRPVLRYEREGVVAILHLNLNPDANIPEVSREVQQEVQSYLEEKAGIHVSQVQVLIEGVSYEARARVD